MSVRAPVLICLGLCAIKSAGAQAPTKSSTSKSASSPSATATSSCPQGSLLVPATFVAVATAVMNGQPPAGAAAALNKVHPTSSQSSCVAVTTAVAYMQATAKALAAPPTGLAGTNVPTTGQGLAATAMGAAGASGLASAAAGASNLSSMAGVAGVAGAAGVAAGGMSPDAMKSAAVTVATAMVPGAALIGPATSAAAPVATGFVKGLAGRFSHPETKESMTKDLQSGRLVVKGIRFADGGDAFTDGSDQVVALLASAVDGVPGTFAMRLAAESDGKASADTSLARRRLERVAGYLQLSGITDARVTLVAPTADKPAKPGEARVELVRADAKP